jgi:hypothetical protein
MIGEVMNKNINGATRLNEALLDIGVQVKMIEIFFTDYHNALLRVDIEEKEILALDAMERYNLFYVCFMKSISVIPTVEMSSWLSEHFSPDYDICGGAGNLGFALGIPTSDSHFRLGDEFKDRMGVLEEKAGERISRPDFTVCRNTEKLTGNAVARLDGVETVIGSWILVQHPNKVVNEALKLIELSKDNPNAIKHLRPSKKVAKMMGVLMKKGSVGIPNGVHLSGLLENANLVFIGNYNIHSPQHLKELYNMHKHVTYTYEDLPFFIIDKQWLRGHERDGFVKFFMKVSK